MAVALGGGNFAKGHNPYVQLGEYRHIGQAAAWAGEVVFPGCRTPPANTRALSPV
ncbi:MAG: hypothetical protein R2874_07870 [Desulfobacterales bacterium]